jgi:molybdopterin/thiamine biosynthesis adenylyltransferase
MILGNLAEDRLIDAGADVSRIRQASILIKVGDVPTDELLYHPLWPLIRGFRAVGFPRLFLRGAIEYFDALATHDLEDCVDQEPGIWLDAGMARHVPHVDAIVDLSNDGASQSICTKLASDRKCSALLLHWGDAWCAVQSQTGSLDDVPPSCAGTPCSAISRIVAGLALQETMIVLDAIPQAAPLDGSAVYDARKGDPSRSKVVYCWAPSSVRDAIIDVVGAGGSGVHFLESFVPLLGMGCTVHLFDFDHVAEENLSSQIAYSEEDVGQSKAEVMAQSLTRYSLADVNLQAFPIRYEERPDDLAPPHARVLCPDNFAVRYFTNNSALSDGVPLAEAGSSPLAAQQRTFMPGRTACLEHRIRDLGAKAKMERRSMSCSRSSAPTLPGTNAIVGGMLAMETLSALKPEVYGFPSRATLTYDCRFPARFGLVDEKPPCAHSAAAGFSG